MFLTREAFFITIQHKMNLDRIIMNSCIEFKPGRLSFITIQYYINLEIVVLNINEF